MHKKDWSFDNKILTIFITSAYKEDNYKDSNELFEDDNERGKCTCASFNEVT